MLIRIRSILLMVKRISDPYKKFSNIIPDSITRNFYAPGFLIVPGISYTHCFTSSFHDDIIPPDPVHLPDLFPVPDDPEPALFMQPDACRIFGKDARLKRPEAVRFTLADQFLQQHFTEAPASPLIAHIHTHFCHPCIYTPAANAG